MLREVLPKSGSWKLQSKWMVRFKHPLGKLSIPLRSRLRILRLRTIIRTVDLLLRGDCEDLTVRLLAEIYLAGPD